MRQYVVNRATMVLRIEEEKQEYTQGFMLLGNVPTSTGTTTWIFYYHKNKVTWKGIYNNPGYYQIKKNTLLP